MKPRPQMRTDEAVREILRVLLATVVRNEVGVREDHDHEPLHDLRVAARRGRALLGQIEKVFPPPQVDALREGLAWLGKVSGPTRDLDVYLEKMNGYRAALPASVRDDLAPLNAFLLRRRREAHAALVAALDTPPYRDLVTRWDALVQSPVVEVEVEVATVANGERPVATVASAHIRRAYRQVWRRGRRIGDDAPAVELHRLRIACKRLRYLLELFRDLYPRSEIDRLIKTLRRLQDNLGDFNDLVVQQRSLTRMAEAMVEEGLAPAATLIAMGRLVAHLELRQAKVRQRFAVHFRNFATQKDRRRFRRLFKKKSRLRLANRGQ